MTRPIVYDATHLVARHRVATPTGIDRVDHAYAVALSAPGGGMAAAVQCAFGWPMTLSPQKVAHYAAGLSARWSGASDIATDRAYNAVRGFVTAPPIPYPPEKRAPKKTSLAARADNALRVAPHLLRSDRAVAVPQGAVYVNVTQNPVLVPRAARFLASRPDVRPVFLVHDLIPIDYPEYFAPKRKPDFERVLATMFRHAAGFIVTTGAVKERLADEMRRRNLAQRPILAAPLPLADGFGDPVQHEPKLAAARYVAMVGTMEPRKNHWLMLMIWRRMLRDGADPPQLVIIGARGWENEAAEDLLRRTPDLARHVIHVSGLSNEGLRRVLAHARALLMPSHAEGYGIPVIEALTLGAPVIASDQPVFREVSQGAATFVEPLDGPGWIRAVLEAAGPSSAPRAAPAAPRPGFSAPTSAGYFASVRDFLSGF